MKTLILENNIHSILCRSMGASELSCCLHPSPPLLFNQTCIFMETWACHDDSPRGSHRADAGLVELSRLLLPPHKTLIPPEGRKSPLWFYFLKCLLLKLFDLNFIYFTFVSKVYHQRLRRSTQTYNGFVFITKLQDASQLSLKQDILPSIRSLANKICHKEGSPPATQLEFSGSPSQNKSA